MRGYEQVNRMTGLVCCAAKPSCDGHCLCAKMNEMVAQLRAWTQNMQPQSPEAQSALEQLTSYLSRLGDTPHKSYESFCLSSMGRLQGYLNILKENGGLVVQDTFDSIEKMTSLLKLREQAKLVDEMVFNRNHLVPLHKLQRDGNIQGHPLNFRLEIWLKMKTDAYVHCMQFVNEQWDSVAEAKELLTQMHSYSLLLIQLSNYLDEAKDYQNCDITRLQTCVKDIVHAEEKLARFDKIFSSLICTDQQIEIGFPDPWLDQK
ncbi:hypothetical protein Ciccas_011764 [Cichlidogyrus casuarinus]|uniref:Uncharacterized protein n=1 Tax=Cichlidogyrus casuarinus TaxID=1844966 RepID=A0ABD2PTB1_9PLAT